MSECSCERAFPARQFKTASDADDFMSGVRLSSVFRYVGLDGVETQRERYRCRECGADWACTIPPGPPFSWGPLVTRRAEPQELPPVSVPPPRPKPRPAGPPEVQPLPDRPAASGAPFALPIELPPAGTPPPPPTAPADSGEAPFLEVGPHRVVSEVFTLIYEDEAAGTVSDVLAALYEWRPGIWTWKANAGFEDIEIEFGPTLAKGQSAFELFVKTWRADLVNPAWRGLKGGKGMRPIHMRGIRKRGEGASGFLGEYYLIIVDTKARKVVAWMMAEAKA